MNIGTAVRKITPKVGTELCGYLARVQPSIGAHDDLFAKVLFLEGGSRRLVWIHCDLVGFSNELASRIRQTVATRLGIDVAGVLLSATHTHAGPATVSLRLCGDVDPAYIEFLQSEIVAGAQEATTSLEEVSLRYSAAKLEGISRDRRAPSANSHVDDRLSMFAFVRRDGTAAAVVANYAVHNVGLSSENRLISADIAGFAASYAHSRIPGTPVVLVTNGGCGNINPVKLKADYAAVKELGTVLGEGIVRGLSSLEECGDMAVAVDFATVTLPLDVPTLEQLEEMQARHREQHTASGDTYVSNRIYDAMRLWHEETTALVKSGNYPKTIEAYVHVVRLGLVVMAGLNAEVFSTMAAKLRETTGIDKLFIIGYANGCVGYLPSREVYAEGGYEVDGAYKYYGNFMLQVGGFEKVRDKIVELCGSPKST